MNPLKRSLKAMILMLFLFFIGCMLLGLTADSVFFLNHISSFYFLLLGIILTMFFSRTIIDERVRKALVSVGWLIILWVFFRAEQYSAFVENRNIVRYLWYGIYIPTLLIPHFSFRAALAVGRAKEEKLPTLQWYSLGTALLCIVTVLTNDMHQLVFSFPEGFDNAYVHGPVFWVIIFWNYVLLFSAVLVLLRKCQLSTSRKMLWIPVCYIMVFIVWSLLLLAGWHPFFLGNNPGEFSEGSCFMEGGFLVLCICIGLIPSNHGYEKFLWEAGVTGIITDDAYQVVYQSPAAVDMTKEQLASEEALNLNENIRVYRRRVSGGYGYWQVDISKMNRINAELEDVQDNLSEESELIRLENELREKRAQIEAKSKLYDDIAVRILPQSQNIKNIVEQTDSDNFIKNMRMCGVYAAYMKRMANLMLIAGNGFIAGMELQLSFLESVRALNKAGILAEVTGDGKEESYPAGDVLTAFEFYEQMLEQVLPAVKAVNIFLMSNVVKITFEGAIPTLPDSGVCFMEVDDDVAFVRIRLGREAEA